MLIFIQQQGQGCLFLSLTFEWGFSKPLPILIRIDREPDSAPPGSPPPSQELIRGLDLETRVYVLSEGTGQRIILPESQEVAPTPPIVNSARPGI